MEEKKELLIKLVNLLSPKSLSSISLYKEDIAEYNMNEFLYAVNKLKKIESFYPGNNVFAVFFNSCQEYRDNRNRYISIMNVAITSYIENVQRIVTSQQAINEKYSPDLSKEEFNKQVQDIIAEQLGRELEYIRNILKKIDGFDIEHELKNKIIEKCNWLQNDNLLKNYIGE